MLRTELQDYLDGIFPSSKIDTEHSLCGKVTIKFDLYDDPDSDQNSNAILAAERALILFDELFQHSNPAIWVLAYDYAADDFLAKTNFLFEQFPAEDFVNFYQSSELVRSRNESPDPGFMEEEEAKITIGKLPVKFVKARNIFTGIANRDLEQEPMITQSVYFLEPKEKIGFHMPDGHGCFIWSEHPERIKSIFQRHIKWINENTMEDIKEYFHNSAFNYSNQFFTTIFPNLYGIFPREKK